MQKVVSKVWDVVLPLALKQVRVAIENGFVGDDKSTGLRGDDGSVAIGTNAYTGLNKNNTAG